MDSRLSSLPDDIIHKILSTVPMKDVVETSVLSSRWRYIWTSMPCLTFSFNDLFGYIAKFTQFVKYVLSHRNSQVPVSCVKLNIIDEYGVASWDIEILIKYILSHNVQQLDVEYMDLQAFQGDLLVTLFSSQALKRFTMEGLGLTASSTLELPALTTLYLSRVKLYPDANTLFSKCPNLKNLTLKSCKMEGSDSLTISHHQLSNLILEHDMGSPKVVNVAAPQLENLTIRYRFKHVEWHNPDDLTYVRDCLREYKHLISAANLTSLIYEGYDPLPLSSDGFHSLEKVDLCICSISQEAAEALELVRLFQQIQSVKFLTLNLEILELLSSYVQVISHHRPPFANLKSLDIYPKMLDVCETPKDITEVKNYLLDSSQGASFTMVSREEAIAERNAAQARSHMTALKRYLDTEKDVIETNPDHMQKPTETQMQLHIRKIKSCWTNHRWLISRGNQIVHKITSDLENIKKVLIELPVSKRDMLQPCFSSLCAEAITFLTKMTERIKIHGSENLNNASDRLHELATSLQSFS